MIRGLVVVALAGLIAACAHPRAPVGGAAPVAGPARAPAPGPIRADHFPRPSPMPECTQPVAEALDARLQRLDVKDLTLLRSEMDEIWKSPCLAHVARVLPPLDLSEPADVVQAVQAHWVEAVRASIGGSYARDGRRVFVVPPSTPAALPAGVRALLSRWLCAADDPECGGRAASYIARAQASFDASEERRRYFRIATKAGSSESYDLCAEAGDPKAPATDGATSFEAWASCVLSIGPWSHRYARLRYRAPVRGWLVLRGRRGHYSFSDEIAAYDLATGAAYIARSRSALVLAGPEVDHAAVDAQRRPEAFAGRVVADQVRELAFVALTLGAVQPVRVKPHLEPVPEHVAITAAPPPDRASPRFVTRPDEWRTSAQTSIAVTYVDGATRYESALTWPDSANAAEAHADELLRIVEAGLERGCPPAKLPASIGRTASGSISPLDADPARLDAVQRDLAAAFAALAPRACKDAR